MKNKEEIEYKGYNIEIIQDENAEFPNEWENKDIFLVYEHRQFDVEREGFKPREIFQYLEDCHEQIESERDSRYDEYFIFVVYAYIHSGVSLSLGDSKYPFNDRWDVSTTGFILVKKDANEGWEIEEKAKEAAESLIEEWNIYLSGEVYGYRISKKRNIIEEVSISLVKSFKEKKNIDLPLEIVKNSLDLDIMKEFQDISSPEELDSCWGFYGKEFCISEAKSIIDARIQSQ